MKSKQARRATLLPGGIPRWIRCYDDGGKCADRYTVVYTKTSTFDRSRRGGCMYVGMSGAPFHPQGVGMHGESDKIIDRPRYGHLGRRIPFTALPADCQQLVLRDYCAYWDLEN